MKGLEFLKNAKLASNDTVKPVLARTTTAKARNPETADIRVYKNGSVYPSAALVAEFDLGYRAKDAEGDKGKAFDVFKSTEYLNTQNWPAESKVIFIAAVNRAEGKAELFGRTTYDENGAASDVMSQGATTFGKELLTMLKDIYDVELTEEEAYIDLVISRENAFNTEDGIYWVPKTVSRGDDKGKSTLVRREDITLFPLVPLSWMEEAGDTEPQGAEELAGEDVPLGDIDEDETVEETAATPSGKAGK